MTRAARPRLLSFVAAGAFAFGAARPAVAETKQACGDAYYAVQVLRDEGKYEDALAAAEICVSADCAKFVRDDCAAWKRDIEAVVAIRRSSVIVEAFDEDGVPIREASATLAGASWLASLDGEARELPPGTHVVEVSAPGRVSQRRSIVVRAGEKEQRVVFTFESLSSLGRGYGPFPWVLGSVGLASLVAGAVTGGFVIDAFLTVQDECDDEARVCSVAGDEAAARGRLLGPLTTGLLVGGGALLGAGVVWKLVDSVEPGARRTALLIAPVIAPGELGLLFRVTR
jgi:hypothetical protein